MSDTLGIYISNYTKLTQSIVDKNGFFDLHDVDPSSLSNSTQGEVTPLYYYSFSFNNYKAVFSIANIAISTQQFKDLCTKYNFAYKYSVLAISAGNDDIPSSATLEDVFDVEGYFPASLHLEMNLDNEDIKPYVYITDNPPQYSLIVVAAVIPSPYDFVTPTDGREFLGWSTSKGGEVEYQAGDIVEREENQHFPELYAIWQGGQEHIIGNIIGAQYAPSDTQILNSAESQFVNSGSVLQSYTETITLGDPGVYYLRCYVVSSYTASSPGVLKSAVNVEKESEDDDLIIQPLFSKNSAYKYGFRIISYDENKKIKLITSKALVSTDYVRSLHYTLLGPF